MKILCVNVNKYKDMTELLVEELRHEVYDILIINADEVGYNYLLTNLKSTIVFVGYSPLTKNELSGICFLLSYINGCNGRYELSLYEEDLPFFTEQNILALSFVNYFESKEVESLMYNIDQIKANISKFYLSMPKIEESIKPYINFNHLIYSFYKTSFGECRSKDMEKGIFTSLRNKTVFEKLKRELSKETNIFPEILDLISCIDIYIRFVRAENFDALTFYMALFLNVSVFNKKRNEFTISYIYLLRAVETALVYYLLNNDIIEINEGDGLSFKGEMTEINGAGVLINEYSRYVPSHDLLRKIRKLNFIRNRVLLTHGYYSPSDHDFDDLYSAAKELIRSVISSDECEIFFTKTLSSLRPVDKKVIFDKLSKSFI
ncbi:hypothetical protein WAA39_002586 [Enterobacter mori]|jgi:hypothetical protein|nr:hypothetical protein [Enterobacter mori]EME8860666.1 hypothetical protein [Enterobacter mori]MCM7580617.1 hypothetical protein [Enterobacter hormaechei]